MADFITPLIDIVARLCGCCTKWVDSIRKLGDNLNSLRSATNQLNSRYLDVKMKVETEEKNPDPERMVLNEVRDWMGRVEHLQHEVQAILQKGDQEIQAKCFGGHCPKNCRASYKLQKMVTQKLSDVNDLISKGHFDVVAENFARDLFDELPVDKVVGVESTFEELCLCFQNNQVRIIGLYGMGGVGKTTLLKKFNNDFLSTISHYVVIWTVASKDVDREKIQDAIRKKLRVQDEIWNNKMVDEKALLLYNMLNKKKFVLLLDDVWERIDLLKLGVPSPNNHECKIIFTTRSKQVCALMDAQRHIKVNCLTPDKAFELFKEKVGETTLENPHILDLSKKVVDECQGLPLALCVVARAMVNKVTPIEWKRAIEILRSYPSKVQGIVDDVYYLLEFSYDRLSNDTCKSCFLYCSLFPEDYNIEKQELIFLWIAQGYLTEFNIYEARKQGEDIISSLKYACLLENGEEENTIKMHDVIRDIALWVACGHGERTKFFVRDSFKTSDFEVYNHAKWEEIEMLSMWGWDQRIQNFSPKPHFPNIVTLLIRNTQIQVFPTEALVLPKTIRVLDLSCNDGITNLPSAIGNFVNLEHMNLSDTKIIYLAPEMKNLKKLRFLFLDGIPSLRFPEKVISSLVSLQSFSLRRCEPSAITEKVLQELEGLDRVEDIRIFVYEKSSLKKIMTSPKLQTCMCELYVGLCSIPRDLLPSLAKMEHLETLEVERTLGDYLEDVPRSSFRGHENIIVLRELILKDCQNILEVNWLIHAPNLEVLEIANCQSLVEVISEDFGTLRVSSNPFCSLTYLRLRFLRKLRSICRMALQFSCLKEIHVIKCPNLKKLPFNSQSALKNLRCFKGDPEWRDQLQWEDEVTRHLLSSKYEWDHE